MKPIYEYLVQNSNDLTDDTADNPRFWIRALSDSCSIAGIYEKSIDGENWEKSFKDTLKNGEKLYIFTPYKANDINYKGEFEVGGNILGLTRKTYNDTEKLKKYEFAGAFLDADIVSARKLDLSHCETMFDCFFNLFKGCKKLINAPELPIKKLHYNCYDHMFADCISLEKAPDLPAIEVEVGSYLSMFEGCTSLKKMPKIQATKILGRSCESMFKGCTNLTTLTNLKFKDIGPEGCAYMFAGCTSLKKIPKLSATNLSENCYDCMFKDCTSLVNVELPAKCNVPSYAYDSMFWNCTGLKEVDISAATGFGEYEMEYFLKGTTPGGILYINKDLPEMYWMKEIGKTWKVVRK